MNLKLLTRLKTRDAAVVYEYLFERLNRSPGSIEGTSCESIAAELARAGILTARGAKFSARVVRAKLDELEELEVVARESIVGASFTLFVFLPYPCAPEVVEEKKAEPVDPYGGRTLFDSLNVRDPVPRPTSDDQTGLPREASLNRLSVSKTETKTETVLETETGTAKNSDAVVNKENNINNKTINKARLKSKKVSTPKPPNVAPPEPSKPPIAAGTGAPSSEKPRTDEIRRRVNFSNPRVAGLRAAVARRMWEPSTNPDLIDRVTALAVLRVGGTTARDVETLINDAIAARSRWERTDGRCGRERIWETVCYQTKRIYETNGWIWTPTKLGSEPRPVRGSRELDRMLAEMERA